MTVIMSVSTLDSSSLVHCQLSYGNNPHIRFPLAGRKDQGFWKPYRVTLSGINLPSVGADLETIVQRGFVSFEFYCVTEVVSV